MAFTPILLSPFHSSKQNCFFRCISQYVFGSPEFHSHIRQLCARFMLIKSSAYAPFLHTPQLLNYLDHISQNGVFGTQIEMHALSWMLDRPICVFSDQEAIPDVTTDANEHSTSRRHPIYITHQWNNHFNVASPIDGTPNIGIGVCFFPLHPLHTLTFSSHKHLSDIPLRLLSS